jgi:hypothetical protein
VSHSKILRQYRLACAKRQVEFISNLSVRQTSVPTDYCIDTVNNLVGSRCWCRPVCGSLSMDVRPFLNREYHSNVLDRLNAVSPNACCSISYVSVAVLTSFWQNLMQTRCSFNTSISQYDGGRDKHDCTVDQLTDDWVKLQPAPLVCGVRRCCQVSYMVVTSMLLVVSLRPRINLIYFM